MPKFSQLAQVSPALPGDLVAGLRGSTGPNTGTDVMIPANTIPGNVVASAIPYTPPGAGAQLTTVGGKLAQLVSVFDYMTPAQQADCSLNIGSLDLSTAITAAAAANADLFWPPGTYSVGALVFATAQNWFCLGAVTLLYNGAANSAVLPMCNFVGQANLNGPFTFNHQANTKNFTSPVAYGANLIAGSALLIQGNYSTVDEIQVINAWDDGVALVNVSNTGVVTTGLPKYCVVSNVRTTGCGVGVHAGGSVGKVGAGIDVASASACEVVNCVDFNSYNGFILDIGAGASANFANCTAWFTLLDGANPTNGSGYGFYVGSADSSFVNCTSVGSAYRGWWVDAPTLNDTFANCYSYFPQKDGWLIKGSNLRFTNCRVNGASAAGLNQADAVLIDSSAGPLVNVMFEGLTTPGTTHRYGINCTGANTITGAVIGGIIFGVTANTNFGSYAIGSIWWDQFTGLKWGVNRTSPGFNMDIFGSHRVTANVANASSLTSVFGDSGNNGTCFIEDFATPAKRAAMGYDPVNDFFVIQAIQAGVAKKALVHNPAGGNVGLGACNITTSAADGYPQIPSAAGAPTGAPAALPGMVSLYYDTTNNKIWVRSAGTWRGVVVA